MPKNVMCKNCNNLKHDWCKKVIDSPCPDMLRDCQYFWERTNADRIRAMSDEELAHELADIWDCPNCSEYDRLDGHPLLKDNHCDQECEKHCLEWLKQPAKGEDNAED